MIRAPRKSHHSAALRQTSYACRFAAGYAHFYAAINSRNARAGQGLRAAPHVMVSVVVVGPGGQSYVFDETARAAVWHRSFSNAAAGIRQQRWAETSSSRKDLHGDAGVSFCIRAAANWKRP
jgi:hypothetical protein